MANSRRQWLQQLMPGTGSGGPPRRGRGRPALDGQDSPGGVEVAVARPPDDDRALPLHTGPHPDDPSLPAVDPLVVLLNRCTYGAREADYQEALALGASGWLEKQLAHTLLDDSALEAQISAALTRVGMSATALLIDARVTENPQLAANELRTATVLRRLYSQRQLFEVMVEFWGDHFNIATTAAPESYFKNVEDREVARAHGFGRFLDLLRANARSLAMLFYLDNVSNRASGPNENYARELLELHTLGADGGYTEQDIHEVARCFTGWSAVGFNTNTPQFAFIPALHDTGAKTVLGTTIPAGGGIEDGEQVLALLAAHASTARHVARKLCTRFIAEDAQETIVAKVEAAYLASQGDTKTMLRALFDSDEFRSSYDRKVKRPVEYLLSTLRVTGATLGNGFLTPLLTRLFALGQLPFRWPDPDGYPDEKAFWVNSGAMLTRWNWAFALAEGRAGGNISLDPASLVGLASTPAQLVDQLAQRLLRRTLTDADRTRLVAFAANGGNPDAALDTTTRNQRARELIATLLASAYFQYR